jgi:hypothetical protein
VAERTGADPADPYPQLMAAVAFAAMQTAMHTWKADDGGQPFGQHVDEVFGLLKNALAQGEAGSGRAGPADSDPRSASTAVHPHKRPRTRDPRAGH